MRTSTARILIYACALGFMLAFGFGCGKKTLPNPNPRKEEKQDNPPKQAGTPPVPPGPEKKPPPAPAAPKLVVTCNVQGATVRLAKPGANGVVDGKTGRVVGLTPCTVDLEDVDVNRLVGGNSSLNVWVELAGYQPCVKVIGLGSGATLQPGHEYKADVKLNKLP